MNTQESIHLRELIDVYAKRLRVLEIQAASYGRECPAHIRTEIEEIEATIEATDRKILALIERPDESLSRLEKPLVSTIITARKKISSSSLPAERMSCPFPGMVPFRVEDARFFYGRETEIQQLLQLLRYQRYLYVIGPSGSGKSSLISAGLLPRLRKSTYFSSNFWLIREMRPGSQPIEALAQAINGDPSASAQAIADLMRMNPPAERVLVIIDQFEEIFTQVDRVEQSRFIAVLQSLRLVESCACLVVIRADFYPDLMTSDLWPIAPRHRLEITPLRSNALRQAIQQPAEDVGVQLEPELLERLVADAADEPGLLPLVQETMVLLWEKMIDHRLSIDAYEQLGSEGRSGLAVAVATKADATIDSLSSTQRKCSDLPYPHFYGIHDV